MKVRPEKVIEILKKHIGSKNGLKSCALVEEVTGNCSTRRRERELRQIIRALREQGWSIGGSPETGYYLAETAEEIHKTCNLLRSRALSSLTLVAKLKRQLPHLSGQFALFPEIMEPKIPQDITEKDYSRSPTINLNIDIPELLYESLKEFCEETQRNREKIIATALASFLLERGILVPESFINGEENESTSTKPF